MRVKIDLISDVHATAAPLREALAHFRREEVDTILCAWDMAGYGSRSDLPNRGSIFAGGFKKGGDKNNDDGLRLEIFQRVLLFRIFERFVDS